VYRIAKDYGYTLAELRKLQDGDRMSALLRAEFFFEAVTLEIFVTPAA
jgi:hypothetical protein